MFVTDTHPLVWYIGGDHAKISNKVRYVFEQAENSESIVYVPIVVFWEIAILERLGHIRLKTQFNHWVYKVLSINGFELLPMTIDIIYRGVGFGPHSDPFDNIIVATVVEMNLPLITKDMSITESNLVEIYW